MEVLSSDGFGGSACTVAAGIGAGVDVVTVSSSIGPGPSTEKGAYVVKFSPVAGAEGRRIKVGLLWALGW